MTHVLPIHNLKNKQTKKLMSNNGTTIAQMNT